MLEYLNSVKGKLFKIIPIMEAENNSISLSSYLDSLWIELSGACTTFPDLKLNKDYITVLNIVGYLSTHTFTFKQCRREIFKAINLIERIVSTDGNVYD